MFDIGMSELLVIGVVALIVIGPKDLPALFHTIGRFTAKARSLGREFNRAMSDAARDTGINEVSDSLKGVANPKKFGLDKLNQAADRFETWEPGKPAAPMATSEATKPVSASVDAEAQPDVAKDEPVADASPAKAPAKKPAAKKPAAKKTPAKKPAAKAAEAKAESAEPAPAKKPAAKPATAKPTTAKKPAVKKPAAKSATSKTTAATKSAATRPAAKKPAAKKPATKAAADTKKAEGK